MWLSSMVWLVAPSLTIGHQFGVSSIGGGEGSTKVLDTDPLCCKQICSGFCDVFQPPDTPPERAIKHKIDLLPNYVLTAKKYYRTSPVELAKIRKQLGKYLSKGWINPNTSLYGVPILLAKKKMEP